MELDNDYRFFEIRLISKYVTITSSRLDFVKLHNSLNHMNFTVKVLVRKLAYSFKLSFHHFY